MSTEDEFLKAAKEFCELKATLSPWNGNERTDQIVEIAIAETKLMELYKLMKAGS